MKKDFSISFIVPAVIIALICFAAIGVCRIVYAEGYKAGKNEGFIASHYDTGYEAGYEDGFVDGRTESDMEWMEYLDELNPDWYKEKE